ncbi:MAG TPA: hypothetical protein VKV26_13470 [Dehalococcoidia bacterium]|nr:hypothetical protein [Dehalococcoidia bacterium]
MKRSVAISGALGGLVLWSAPILWSAPAQQGPTAITIEPQPVYRGCNSIVVTAPLGTSWKEIVERFADPSTVRGVWQFDNVAQRYHGVYFPSSTAPTDGPASSAASVMGLFFCVSADGSIS